jgi:hypothetical protein
MISKKPSMSSKLQYAVSYFQIYLESTKWGPEHPYVAHNYFLMGKVFTDMGSQSIGESFFAKVA